jgi:hypothetical protein
MIRDRSDVLFTRIGSYAKEIPGLIAWLRRMLFGTASYRRGAHDMRGRGPKWHEKHRR